MTNRNWRIVRSAALAAATIAGASLTAPWLSATARAGQAKAPQTKPESAHIEHEVYGIIRSVEGSTLTIETRAKKTIRVDTKTAAEAQRSVVLVVGHAVLVRGTTDAKGVLRAASIQRAKQSAALWPEDK